MHCSAEGTHSKRPGVQSWGRREHIQESDRAQEGDDGLVGPLRFAARLQRLDLGKQLRDRQEDRVEWEAAGKRVSVSKFEYWRRRGS
jgi:hypothetical protein